MRGIAGIVDAERVGLGVDGSCAVLRRFEYVERRLVRLLAGWLPPMPLWEAKQMLGRHIWEDAEHVSLLRKRIVELRMGSRSFEHFQPSDLALLLDEAIHAGNPAELLGGVYLVIKQRLIDGYRWYLAHTNPLVDFPSHRILRWILQEEEEQMALAREAYVEALVDADPAVVADWQAYLDSILSAGGGVTGHEPVPAGVLVPERRRSGKPWRLPREPGRDPRRFQISPEGNSSISVSDRPGTPEENRANLVKMMRGRMNEMQAAECVAATLYEADGMAWPFYQDLARHLWDEIRHCCFGETLLATLGYDKTAFPLRVGSGRFYLALDLLRRYVQLGIIAEHGMMKRRYKQFEKEFCEAIGDQLAAEFQDFDWADEALHVAIARRWILELLGGDAARIPRLIEEIAQARESFTAAPTARDYGE